MPARPSMPRTQSQIIHNNHDRFEQNLVQSAPMSNRFSRWIFLLGLGILWATPVRAAEIDLIPQPMEVKPGDGVFHIPDHEVVSVLVQPGTSEALGAAKYM